MKKTVLMALAAAAVFFHTGQLTAKEYENVLLYKNCGTWKHNGTIIESGPDAGRITWDGKLLRFTPRAEEGLDLGKFFRFDFSPGEGIFDLKNIYCFGFVIRVSPEMTKRPISVKFIYEEGDPVIWNITTPAHIGWRGVNAKITADKRPYIRPGKLKSVEFTTDVPGFQAMLDDIRFVPAGLNFQFEDAWVPPVTNGCFFPEYTLEQQRVETLNDPDFKAKMDEIERLRHTKLRVTLKSEYTDPEELHGNPLIARIRPDGSIEGWSYEDAEKFHRQERPWHDVNESFMVQACNFYNRLLTAWEWGRVSRTEENRKKLFKSLIRTLTADSNRRQECFHYVVPAFLLPKTACRAYQVFFDEMDAVEKGTNRDPDAILLNRLLKEAASWCYYHTLYNTVGPVLTVDSFSGDNSDWTGGNFGYRPTFRSALICRNPKMLDVIAQVARGALSVTSYNTMKDSFWLDGMTADGSAWGHKNQNYPFNYPLDGLLGVGELIGNLSGTRWGLASDAQSFDVICRYMEALLWHGTGWAGNEDQNNAPVGPLLQRDIPAACGRYGQLYREGKGYGDFGKVCRTLDKYLKVLPEGSDQRKRLQRCADVITGKIRELPEGTRYFWNNDLLICREKESVAAVSMLSSRVRSMESTPSASHFTDFWSDGAAWIMKHFDSYRIARGFMKPYAIPGVTSRQWDFTHPGRDWRCYTGMYNFAGGAADGQYAVCGYHMQRKPHNVSPDPNFYDLEAEKSYFWLNGKLICIGTGISDKSRRDVPVATTVDQTLWRGLARDASGTGRNPGESFQTDSQLLWHDGVGYIVLTGKGTLSGETRKDRWTEFAGANRKAKNLPKSAPILMFQIDHGKNPENDSYAYVVDFHSPDFAALKKMAEKPSFEILSATSDVHAVQEKKSGTLAAVFYKPGEAGGLSVDAPAVVLLRQMPGKEIHVTVSDPEQDPKRTSVMLGWDGKFYEIPLPGGLYCGQPVTVNLSKLKPLSKEKAMKRTAIALALTAAICCPAQNLIKNGDFQSVDEKGKLTDWSYKTEEFSMVKLEKPGEAEKQVVMAKVIPPPVGEKNTRTTVNMRQRIQLKKAGKYNLTVVGKIKGNLIINCSWSFFDQDWKRIPTTISWSKGIKGDTQDNWLTDSHILEIPSEAKIMNLTISAYADRNYKQEGGTSFIKAVSLTPVTGE